MTATCYSSKTTLNVAGLPAAEVLAALASLDAVAPVKGSVQTHG